MGQHESLYGELEFGLFSEVTYTLDMLTQAFVDSQIHVMERKGKILLPDRRYINRALKKKGATLFEYHDLDGIYGEVMLDFLETKMPDFFDESGGPLPFDKVVFGSDLIGILKEKVTGVPKFGLFENIPYPVSNLTKVLVPQYLMGITKAHIGSWFDQGSNLNVINVSDLDPGPYKHLEHYLGQTPNPQDSVIMGKQVIEKL